MSYFLDLSKLRAKDFEEIKAIGMVFNLDFQQALHKWMNENPGKVKVLGEMKNGEIIRDEIDKDGVKEYKGKDAIIRIIREAFDRNKENDR